MDFGLLLIISVNSQVFSHTSTIQLIEKKFGVYCPNISPWRRAVCGDLLYDFFSPHSIFFSFLKNAQLIFIFWENNLFFIFNGNRSTLSFDKPNYTWPDLPNTDDYVKNSDTQCNTLPKPEVPNQFVKPIQEKGKNAQFFINIYFLISYVFSVNLDFFTFYSKLGVIFFHGAYFFFKILFRLQTIKCTTISNSDKESNPIKWNKNQYAQYWYWFTFSSFHFLLKNITWTYNKLSCQSLSSFPNLWCSSRIRPSRYDYHSWHITFLFLFPTLLFFFLYSCWKEMLQLFSVWEINVKEIAK